MIKAATSKSVSHGPEAQSRCRQQGEQTRDRVFTRPLTWLNLVCLDAPLVAVSWQWLFARSFDISVPHAASAALFLTAWLIYLADRFGDSLSFGLIGATSLRQRFCRRHRLLWIITVLVIAVADLCIVWQLEWARFLSGTAVGVLALGYLVLNQRIPTVWRRLPAKEVAIGSLFAAGTAVSLGPAHSLLSAAPWLLFACLCALNCISIACWERDLDQSQRRISIATEFPKVGGYVLGALAMIAAASLALSLQGGPARSFYGCVATSAVFLGSVHALRNKLQPDNRTALADLVLLMPAVGGLVTAIG